MVHTHAIVGHCDYSGIGQRVLAGVYSSGSDHVGGRARVVRGQVMSVKQRQYITAARALGFSHGRIIWRHILPNSLTPVIIISAANFASAILIESGLSFLGIGAQPPIPSWGSIIKDHYAYIILGKPFLAVVPGFAIMIMVMAFMLMGNALREVLDVNS